jgi:hypothetical protein
MVEGSSAKQSSGALKTLVSTGSRAGSRSAKDMVWAFSTWPSESKEDKEGQRSGKGAAKEVGRD